MNFKLPPFAHQLEAFELSKEKKSFGLFMEVGTGKTKIIVDTAAHLYLNGAIDSAIVIAPNLVHRNWLGEIMAHMSDDVAYEMGAYSSGMNIAEGKEFNRVAQSNKGLRILTFNIELLSTDSGYDYVKKYLKNRDCLMIIDESQKIKTPGSRRTKRALKLGDHVPFRRIMTGTNVTQGLEDLYAQFGFLDKRIIGVKTFTEFKTEFCKLGGFTGTDIVGYHNVDTLRSRIAPFVYEKDKKDCLDLPPKTYLTRDVELSNEQWKHYKELKKDFITWIKGSEVNETNAAVRMIRLRQILSGFLKDESGSIIEMPCSRPGACADLVAEAVRGKVLIWCVFHYDVEKVCEALTRNGIGHVPFYGAVKEKDRLANMKRWREDPGTVALVGTAATGGVGFTLNEADTTIFYNNSFNLEHRLQALGRNDRIGQDKPITIYDMIAKGTYDIRVRDRLQQKIDIGKLVKGLNNLETKGETVGFLMELFEL